MTIKTAAEIMGLKPRQALNILRAAGLEGQIPETEEALQPGQRRPTGPKPEEYDDDAVYQIARERRAKAVAALPPEIPDRP